MLVIVHNRYYSNQCTTFLNLFQSSSLKFIVESKSDTRWQLSHDHLAGSDEKPVVLPLDMGWYNVTLTNSTLKRNYAGQGCQSADSSLKLYAQAKLRSIDSCQNGTCAYHYQKTNNVGSGPRRYEIWQSRDRTPATRPSVCPHHRHTDV